jgi:AraC-like DNA-binding protein
MIYKIHKPQEPLSHFVDFFVYYEGYNPEHTVDRFLPDGNTEIIIDLTDQPKYILDNESLKPIQSCQQVWASGLRTEFITIPSVIHNAMFLIYFRKGMAASFYPLPMNELTDHVVDANLIWCETFGILREQLLHCSGIEEKFTVAEQFLLQHFSGKFTSNACVEFALDAIIKQPNNLRLEWLNKKIGYSQKHFISMFKEHVGVTPKSFLQIMRFQHVIQDIDRTRTVDWIRTALDCGYYDQAHFINDFKRFSGFTPEEYLNKKNDILNYVPVA